MPNLCTGFINVRGYAPNVDEFIRILQANYSYCIDYNNGNFDWSADPKNFSHIPHFFRVFRADILNEVWHSGVYKTVCVDIEVAWSAWSCMFDGPYTYYRSMEDEHPGQHFASTIPIESKRLQLEIEMWTYESGMCFQEHYKLCSGIFVKNEEYTFNAAWLEDYSNYNEFISDHNNKNISMSEEEFNRCIQDEEYWYEDPIEEEVDFLPEDEPIYLAHLVMVKKV